MEFTQHHDEIEWHVSGMDIFEVTDVTASLDEAALNWVSDKLEQHSKSLIGKKGIVYTGSWLQIATNCDEIEAEKPEWTDQGVRILPDRVIFFARDTLTPAIGHVELTVPASVIKAARSH